MHRRYDCQRCHAADQRRQYTRPVQVPIFPDQPAHHRNIHSASPSRWLCTLAIKISSKVITSTACTETPTSVQAAIIVGSNLLVVITGRRLLPSTFTIPGRPGSFVFGGSTSRTLRHRSRNASLFEDSRI